LRLKQWQKAKQPGWGLQHEFVMPLLLRSYCAMDRGLNLSSMPDRVPSSIQPGLKPDRYSWIADIAYGEEIMKLTELLLAELEREADGTRRALARVPEGQNDWQPHPKSMPLGYLASLVATMPSWVAAMVNQDELDLKSPGAAKFKPLQWRTRAELASALEGSVAEAREALQNTTDEHLMTPWKFVIGDEVVNENPRHVMIADSVFNHLVHHRGQLSVYLRLNEASVPAISGSAAITGSLSEATGGPGHACTPSQPLRNLLRNFVLAAAVVTVMCSLLWQLSSHPDDDLHL
jgi:uncharacterized damage-inducible protein DinB